jgi:hypothetical protein
MAEIIKKLDAQTFLHNGEPKSKTYGAFGYDEKVDISARGGFIDRLVYNMPFTQIETQDTTGATLVDGASATIEELVASLNTIINLDEVTAGGIPEDYQFADAAARDTYFTTNFAELLSGIRIVLFDGGAASPIEQKWLGATAPGSYVNTNWITSTP